MLAQEFDLYLMRHPRERAKYAREVREDQRRLAALLERGAAERGEPLSMDAEQLARTIEAIAYGLLHTFMLDPRSVDEELCVGAFAVARRGDVVNRLRGTRPAELGAQETHDVATHHFHHVVGRRSRVAAAPP